MTSRELVRNAVQLQLVDRIPVQNEIPGLESMPNDVVSPPFEGGAGLASNPCRAGRWVDQWGCVWEASEDGVCGEVKGPPLAGDWSRLARWKPPFELIQQTDLSGVDAFCAGTQKFVMPQWGQMPNPFERMQHLRGAEQLLMDIAYDEPELIQLRDRVHEFYMRYLERWVKTDVDAIHIADDWGAQQALLISPARWRELFKPLYKDYCDMAHAHGKLVLMHSDGYIADIIPDLIEVGVNAVNTQIFCMGIETLASRFAGRICFWGEVDRQYLLTRGSVDEVRAAVQRVAAAFLGARRTGVVGQCFWGKDHKIENMAAVFDEWSRA